MGDDLLCTVRLPMTAAALGASVELPTLEADVASGGDVERVFSLDIRPGTQSGEMLAVRGRGVPRLRGTGRGHGVATFIVETPTKLDGDQEELLRQLAELRGEESPDGALQKAHRSVFERFKDAFGG
jgi:molecular chaperone DnaJ